jgi:hypothetical protein
VYYLHQAREEEAKLALKEALAQRHGAAAEVEAVRESLKESQLAVDTTRALLEQQSHDHLQVSLSIHSSPSLAFIHSHTQVA